VYICNIVNNVNRGKIKRIHAQIGTDFEYSCPLMHDSNIEWFWKESRYSKNIERVGAMTTIHIVNIAYKKRGFYYCYGSNENGVKVLLPLELIVYG